MAFWYGTVVPKEPIRFICTLKRIPWYMVCIEFTMGMLQSMPLSCNRQ